MSAVDEATVERLTNGQMDGPVFSPDPHPEPARQPLPAEILGGNLALLVAAIAATLPQELAPQSRYQVAVDLAKTIVGSDLARVLAP